MVVLHGLISSNKLWTYGMVLSILNKNQFDYKLAITFLNYTIYSYKYIYKHNPLDFLLSTITLSQNTRVISSMWFYKW